MQISKDNYIHLEGGKFARQQYAKTDLENLFRTFRNHADKDLLVVHFHGGLVSFKKGLEVSARLKQQCYAPAGAYPVFFLWESHPWETIMNYLSQIFRESMFQALRWDILRFAVSREKQPLDQRGQRLTLLSDSDVREELDLIEQKRVPYAKIDERRVGYTAILSKEQKQQLKELIYKDFHLKNEVKDIVEELFPLSKREALLRSSTATFMSDNILSVTRQKAPLEMEKTLLERITAGGITVIERVLKRHQEGRYHGLRATVVEEMLREFSMGNAEMLIWERMKKDISDSFKLNGNEVSQKYGGTAFLEELKNGWEDGHKPRIVLVGHSAGAIYICRWLEAVEKLQLPDEINFDVIFLAPACDFDLFSNTLRYYRKRIKNFRMFGMEDKHERKDQIFWEIYPRSLLYFVCGALEFEADQPLVGMERFYSRQWPFDPNFDENLKEIFDYLDTDSNKIVWAKEDRGDGLKSHSTKHGDFDDDLTTLESIKHILQNGY